jgi:hypothetical protein
MPTLCSTHALTRAGWQCTSCGRFLCPDCALSKPIRNAADTTLCVHCGNLAQILMVRKDIKPYWTAFPSFVRAMFSTAGVIQMFAVALVMTLASLLPGASGRGIAMFVFVSYYFQVIRRCAQGQEHLPEPDDFTGLENYWIMTRFSFASALIWAPAVYYVFRNATPLEILNDPARVFRTYFDGWAAGLIAFGIIYYPAAIITAAIAESILAMLNPMITIRMMLRIPGQYFATVLVWLFIAGLDYAFGAMVSGFQALVHIPILSALVIQFFKLPLPILTGFILGRLIFQNAEDFGIVRTDKLYEPEWPGVKPRAIARAQATARK